VAGLPEGYSVKALASGSTDLLESPLAVSAAAPPAEIVIRLGVATPPPWVRVRGRMTREGRPAAPAPASRVTLTGIARTDIFETAVRADGSFEFPQVLPGKYDARFVPGIPGFDTVRLAVGPEDVNGWEIAIPQVKPQITVKAVVAGGDEPPNFQLIFYDVPVSPESSLTRHIAIPMTPGGTFTTTLPAGEYRRIVPASLPRGYTVKSFKDGAIDLLKNPLKVDGRTGKALVLTLTKKP
jgi:hypothetical protein